MRNDGNKDLGSVVTLVSSSKWPTWPTRSLRPLELHEKSFSGARKPSKGKDERLVHYRQARSTGLVDLLNLALILNLQFDELLRCEFPKRTFT